MPALRPSAKVGIIFLGFLLALALASFVVILWQSVTQGPIAQASSGMHAFGDLLLGIAAFGVFASVPFALSLYWLRPVARFWFVLRFGALLCTSTGVFALIALVAAGHSTSNWIFLIHARIGLMPLTALALLACAFFAPQPRDRWLLFAAAASDGAIFMGIVLVNFVLPGLGRG